MNVWVVALVLCTCSLMPVTDGFPDGAPIEGCIYQTVPNHPGTKSLEPETFYHEFVATSGTYHPGSTIHGK